MKRNLLIGIIGLASSASVLAQGHILISNYLVPPYNQIVWDATVPTVGGTAVTDESAELQIWYGDGIIVNESQLQPGVSFFINPSLTYNGGYGPGGYFDPQLQVLPTWQPGDVFTFQLRVYLTNSPHAPGWVGFAGGSVLWTEQDAIVSTSDSPLLATTVPGVVFPVPEPSTFTLAGMGLGAVLLVSLQRKSSGELESQNQTKSIS